VTVIVESKMLFYEAPPFNYIVNMPSLLSMANHSIFIRILLIFFDPDALLWTWTLLFGFVVFFWLVFAKKLVKIVITVTFVVVCCCRVYGPGPPQRPKTSHGTEINT